MTKITENDIELLAIEEFQALGYHYIYGPDIAPDGEFPERSSYSDIVLVNRLRAAIEKHNPTIPLMHNKML